MPGTVNRVPFMPKLERKKRVAAYARVSSGKDAMPHSLSSQVAYYSELIQKRKDWEYAGVYADEALTGTKDSRGEFQRLLADCRSGRIDQGLTKSISRFARNTVTLLNAVRELKALGVDIFFEEAQIDYYTNTTHQSILSDDVLSTLGEERNADGDYSKRVKFSQKASVRDGNDSESPVSQEIGSAKTSIKQVPALFKDPNVSFGNTNIDIGGGRFDLATDYLASIGTKNMVFDPYNRSEDVNSGTLGFLRGGRRADTATCANVLNVIKEADARANVILEAAKSVKPDGEAYFMVYEGDGSGVGKQTTAGWQNNRKSRDYMDEIRKYFRGVKRQGKLITATEPKRNLP